METLEILSDEDLMAALRQSIKEVSEGKAVAWDKAKQELQRDLST